MKLVITGALGHIGSRLLRTLPSGEYNEVLLIDNLATGRHGSLLDLPEDIPFRFLKEDVLDADLPAHFEGAHAVVHLAAVTDPSYSFDHPEETARINEGGCERVARACAQTGSRLVFPSSTSVYTPLGSKVTEACAEAELQPHTPYAIGKLRSERLLSELAATAGLSFACVRLGTIFGPSPGMRFHTAVNRFAYQACAEEPLTVWRTALHQVRPYLEVGDAARALLLLSQSEQAEGGTYNAVTENATVERILEVLRVHVPGLSVETVDARAMNEFSYAVSSDKIRGLGFVPRGSLETGIRETVAFLRSGQGASPVRDSGARA